MQMLFFSAATDSFSYFETINSSPCGYTRRPEPIQAHLKDNECLLAKGRYDLQNLPSEDDERT